MKFQGYIEFCVTELHALYLIHDVCVMKSRVLRWAEKVVCMGIEKGVY